MRKAILAASTLLLVGSGLALAQQFGSSPVRPEPSLPMAAQSPTVAEDLPPPTVLPEETCIPCETNTPARCLGLWGSGEYLLWWIKNGGVPPLVTVGGDGVPGSPGTQVLVDSLGVADSFKQGGRFALGYQFRAIPFLSIEANFFFLTEAQDDLISSGGDPVLGRPYINVATGLPAATLIASPGIAEGYINIWTQTSLAGTDVNLAASLIGRERVYLKVLGGFRHLSLVDQLTITEQFQVSPSVPGFGGNSVNAQDQFRTVNSFYGGQVGLETGVRLGVLTIDFRGKFALGQMQQVAYVNGATNVLAPDGSTSVYEGGLLALRSNIGRYRQEELAFIPEVGLNVGLQVTRHLNVLAGYSFLWVSTLARAGQQIDPVINESQFPILSGNGPLIGPARPAFHFNSTDFWAQGLSFGLALRW